MIIQLEIIGVFLIALALLHIGFPKYFKWELALKPLDLMNRQMMQVHTFFIAFVVLLFGVLCLTSSNELISTVFGRKISLGLAIFWGVRFIFQIFVYSPKLWKGKKVETAIHILFTLLWIYMSSVFFIIYFN